MRRKIALVVGIVACGGCGQMEPPTNGKSESLDSDGGADLRQSIDLSRICEPDFEAFTSAGDPTMFCKGKGDGGNAFEQLKDGCTPFYLVDGNGNRVASPVCCAGLKCVPPSGLTDGGLCLWHCE